jgi:hypothetical protein
MTSPLRAMADWRTRGEFMAWRDRLAAKSTRQIALDCPWRHPPN